MKLRRRPVLSRDFDEVLHNFWWIMRCDLLKNEIEHFIQVKGFSPVCCLMWFRSDGFGKIFPQVGHLYFGNLLELDVSLSVSWTVPACRASWKMNSALESVEKVQSLHFHSFSLLLVSATFGASFFKQLPSRVCQVTSCDRAKSVPHRGHLKRL